MLRSDNETSNKNGVKLSNTNTPIKKERKTLQVDKEIWEKLYDDHKEKHPEMTFTKYIEYKLDLMFQKESWVNRNYPHLSFQKIRDDRVVVIYDKSIDPDSHKEKGYFDVTVKKQENGAFPSSKYECNRCDPKEICPHVMLTQAIKASSVINA